MSRTRPSFLPAGGALAGWLSSGPGPRPRAILWAYRWRAFWFDRNWRRQETLHPPRLSESEKGSNLIFVLGLWRSGTTLMHELLASGPEMAAPRTWQCLNPSGFRIAGPPRTGGRVARPMDSVVVDALSPQEDELALLARGAPSAYRAWLDPRRWQEMLPALSQDAWLALPERDWLADWRTFLSWCMPSDAKMLVVKSPNHTFRIKAIRRAWPEARFVWTLRDPADTWQSNRKMWAAMTSRYGLWPWDSGALDGLLAAAFREYALALRWAGETIGPDHLAFIAYDRLASAPAQTVHAVAERFSLGGRDRWESPVQDYLARSGARRPDSYAASDPLPEYGGALIGEIGGLHQRMLDSRHALH